MATLVRVLLTDDTGTQPSTARSSRPTAKARCAAGALSPPAGFEPAISGVKAPSVRRPMQIGSGWNHRLGPKGLPPPVVGGTIDGATGFHAADRTFVRG